MKRMLSVLFLVLVAFSTAVTLPTVAQGTSQAELAANLGLPATVFIVTGLVSTVRYPTDTGFYDLETTVAAVGSGFFVNSEGYVVTNGHVVCV